jgi:hypothetical protein
MGKLLNEVLPLFLCLQAVGHQTLDVIQKSFALTALRVVDLLCDQHCIVGDTFDKRLISLQNSVN